MKECNYSQISVPWFEFKFKIIFIFTFFQKKITVIAGCRSRGRKKKTREKTKGFTQKTTSNKTGSGCCTEKKIAF
ncbi:hypothetical protein HK096_000105 [Nowakowskiella sp. JEL0078]|nr:hypothetical protein HK096_000105 [Nowakowskiella sp. JEL0078]